MPLASDDLRAALVRAARLELQESGPGGVSLRAVARRAGVSHAAPAYAFGDRAGLMTSVAADGFSDLARVMDDPPAPTGREGVAALGRRSVAFAAEPPALYDLMFRPAGLVADDPHLVASRTASLRALTGVTGGAGGQVQATTLISWAFAHGVASLIAGGSLTPADAAPLVSGFAALVHPDASGDVPRDAHRAAAGDVAGPAADDPGPSGA